MILKHRKFRLLISETSGHREQKSSLAQSAIIGFTEIPERLPVKLLLSDVHN